MWTPPAELAPPSKLTRRIGGLLWWALLAVAVVGQIGGVWRSVTLVEDIDPIFASVGLQGMEYPEGIVVSPATRATRAMGIPEEAWLFAIDGKAVSDDTTPDQAAAMLKGRDGTPVTINVQVDEEGTVYKDFRLIRSGANRAEIATPLVRYVGLGLNGALSILAALVCVGVSAVLWWRRPEDPIAAYMGFAFLLLGAWSPQAIAFWNWGRLFLVSDLLLSSALTLFVMVLPAFPNGRFAPRWTRWMLVAGPVTWALALFTEADWTILPFLFLLLFSLYSLLRRYRRAGAGIERQQMKWGAFGFLGSLPILIAVGILFAIFDEPPLDTSAAAPWVGLVTTVMSYLAIVMIPLGVMVSLLRYRLNDADAAIGRSAGYATVTLLIGVIWTVSTTATNSFISSTVGSGNAAMSAGLSTMVAAAVLGPAKVKIMAWTERRFQRALVALRALPGRLAQWQQGDDPELVASVALAALAQGINADRGAIVYDDAEGAPRVLALFNVAAETMGAQLGEAQRGASAFPVQVELNDGTGPVAVMLLGARSDGSPYSSDERDAIALVREPLAHALRATMRRARRNAAFDRLMAAVTGEAPGAVARSL